MTHIVTAPLVITKKPDGSDLYLYDGAELPDTVDADEVKRLVSIGLVDKVADGRTSKAKPTSESN